MDDQTLNDIATLVKTNYEEAVNSMIDWVKANKCGAELIKKEEAVKDTPFKGASNYKSTLLQQAAIGFGDRAKVEILSAKRNLVGASAVGSDQDKMKEARAKRISDFMSHEINNNMNNWRGNEESILYALPMQGCIFKKPIFNSSTGRNESHVIQYPYFAVNQAKESMEDHEPFTQILDGINQSGVNSRVKRGLWVDPMGGETTTSDPYKKKKDAQRETETGDVNDDFLEQYLWYDLDDDGIDEPYIVTYFKPRNKVVRILPRYTDQTVMVSKMFDGRKVVVSLEECVNRSFEAENRFRRERDISELTLDDYLEKENAYKGAEVTSVYAETELVKIDFLKPLDNTFLGVSYAWILGSTVDKINTTTRQLSDAGTLHTIPHGYAAKNWRDQRRSGDRKIMPGTIRETNLSPQELQSSLFFPKFGEPSQVLYSLLEKLELAAKEFVAQVDISGKVQSNTAPTTALTIVNEMLIPQGALFGRVIDAMTEEFKILYRLHGIYGDPVHYSKVLDDDAADWKKDFEDSSMDVVPTANKQFSSKMQRIQANEIQYEMIPLILQAGGNPIPIIQDRLELSGRQDAEIIMSPDNMPAEQKQALEQMKQMQQQELQLKEQQLQNAHAIAQEMQRDNNRKDREVSIKEDESKTKAAVAYSEMQLNIAKMLKTVEEAETESLKNQINMELDRLRVEARKIGEQAGIIIANDVSL